MHVTQTTLVSSFAVAIDIANVLHSWTLDLVE